MMDVLGNLFGRRNDTSVRIGKLRFSGADAFTTELEFQEVTRPQSVAAQINVIEASASDQNDEPWFLVTPAHGMVDGEPTYWMYAKSRGVYWRSSYAITEKEFTAMTKMRVHLYIE